MGAGYRLAQTFLLGPSSGFSRVLRAGSVLRRAWSFLPYRNVQYFPFSLAMSETVRSQVWV